MRRSKLENYEAILAALAKRPLTVDSIAYKTNMDCTVLGQYLESLMRNGLVVEKFAGKRKVYAITERGLSVFRTLSFQRYLEKIAKTIKTVDTLEKAPAPTISNSERKEETSG
ncbi:ArsR family transcriptional regulator [Candidatus Bathyarchaeota archaeon]|nr:ArsR family transcriptional regulator [Candidatus Bathyarchaeota archaeon]